MSIFEITYYQGVCDWPECPKTPHTEYSAWAHRWSVVEEIQDAGWWATGDGHQHYCTDHPAVWLSDVEDYSELVSFPDPPYLLIGDDASVALIAAPSDGGLFEEPTRVALAPGDRATLLTIWGEEICTVIKTGVHGTFPMVTVATTSGDTVTVNRSSLKEIE